MEILVSDIRARRRARADAFLERITKSQTERDFIMRLTSDPRLERLFVEAVGAAVDSAVEAKRRVLANAVADASIDPLAEDRSEWIVDALKILEVQHVRALALLSDEWERTKRDTSQPVTWGTSDVWKSLPGPIKSTLVRAGVAKPSPGTYVAVKPPRRAEGITDFGLELVELLRAEGWRSEASARGWDGSA